MIYFKIFILCAALLILMRIAQKGFHEAISNVRVAFELNEFYCSLLHDLQEYLDDSELIQHEHLELKKCPHVSYLLINQSVDDEILKDSIGQFLLAGGYVNSLEEDVFFAHNKEFGFVLRNTPFSLYEINLYVTIRPQGEMHLYKVALSVS